MKNKMFKLLGASLFAVAILVSANLNKPDAQTALLKENVEAIAMADGEVIIGPICHKVYSSVCVYDDGYKIMGRFI